MTLEDRYVTATPEGVSLDVVLAGLGSRFVAVLLDTLIQLAAFLLFLLAFGLISGDVGGETGTLVASGGIALFGLFDFLGYFVICEMLLGGRSIGKLATGLRVIRVGGGAIGFWSSLIRNVLRLVDYLPSLYLVGCVMVLATPRNQRLGDLAASTIVVREKLGATRALSGASWSDPAQFGSAVMPGVGGSWGPPPAVWLPPQLASWDVSAIPDPELALARRFLANRAGYSPDARLGLATDLANRIWPFVAGPAAPGHPEAFLEAVMWVKSARR